MTIVADTNIWLRIADDHAAQHALAEQSIAGLLARNFKIYLVPQNLVEFWAVATRPPEGNGLGWTIERTVREVTEMCARFELLPENEYIFQKWLEIVHLERVAGKQVHDARLVAQLIIHRVSHLLTFNSQHFRRFPSISVLRPEELGLA